ncbi:MAG: DUF58 domain-containing protein [Rhodocyclaceae bacterium]|jgi:uncharacterized protein (DUF58 family)|nr:DUF58 domain-containing protein [Rhodocyclaceae bacterium]
MKLPGLALPAWPARHAKSLLLGFLTLVAYVAAINRVQALPWAIAALMTATLVTGLAWPHWLVKRLSVVRRGPERAREGETIRFHVEVTNHGRLPRFMVELVDQLPFVGAAGGAVGRGAKTLGMVAHVPGGGTCRFEVPVLCEKRGFYRLGPVGLVSSFPLGLAEARQQRNDGVQNLTIYPDIFAIMGLPLRGAPSQIHRGGYLLPEGAGAAEFSGLREYRRGDNPRHVHWPTTARLNALMVREFEPLASACMIIAIDQSGMANVGAGRQASFEYAVRIAGSIARYACSSNLPIRVVGEGSRPLYLPGGIGEHHYQRILDELAVVDADGVTPYAKLLQRVAVECRQGETVVVFLGEPAAMLVDTLQAVALLRARGAHVHAIVFERDSFRSEREVGADGTAMAVAGLLDMGAHCLRVRKGDDLVKLFNP